MSRKNVAIINRYPAELVHTVAEKLMQVLNDIAPGTALMTGEFTPEELSKRDGRLHTSIGVVADAESKNKSNRDERDLNADDTYEAIVRIHDISKGVFGAHTSEYRRVKAVYDELKKKRSRKSGGTATDAGAATANGPTAAG